MAALAAALIAVLCAGIWLGGHPADLPGFLRDSFVDESTTLSGEAAETIQDHYYRSVPRNTLNDGSISGMIGAIHARHKEDRFSHYFDPQQAQVLNEETSGRFTGVGLSVDQVKRGLKVVEAFKGSPAQKAGIGPGDLIVSVNGASIAGQSSDLSTAKIKGAEGTSVTLGVVPAGGSRTRQIKLRRQEISTPVVDTSAKAVLTSSVFLPKDDRVVSTRSRTEGTKVYRADGGQLPRRPMVVLIDRGTASAAEILASALADNGLATVVGTRSFGKGLFQDVLGLSNGGELDLTVGEFFTADGISLAPKGIHPDVFAKDNLKTKVDAGARFLITQLFFDNRVYFDFVAAARERAIDVPIIPGVIPIASYPQVQRICKLCDASIPPELDAAMRALGGDPEAEGLLGVAYAARQCEELLASGAPGVHFYALNRAPGTRAVLAALRTSRPWERAATRAPARTAASA